MCSRSFLLDILSNHEDDLRETRLERVASGESISVSPFGPTGASCLRPPKRRPWPAASRRSCTDAIYGPRHRTGSVPFEHGADVVGPVVLVVAAGVGTTCPLGGPRCLAPVALGLSRRNDTMALDQAEQAERQAALDDLMALMRPAVEADGGDLVLTDVDLERGVVEVQLQGACGSCAISGLTLQGGVERLMRQRLTWITGVKGTVDDSMDFLESASLGRGGYVPKAD